MFIDKLKLAWQASNSLVCVGLDPDRDKIPGHIGSERQYFDFCKEIVDATAEFACAFKPQAAHFAAVGREQELADLIAYIKTEHADRVVILDAKRGDIGSTAAYYAEEAYVRYGADTVTLNPYLGEESIAPFLSYEAHGVVVLCRTSNADSDWLQKSDEPPIFERVAARVRDWNTHGQCMLVTGATYPDEIARVRAIVGPDLPFLVPGIGAQGGDLQAVLANGLNESGNGLVISSSRGILYAGDGQDFATQAAHAAQKLRDEINALR